MTTYKITGNEIVNVIYTVEADNEGEAWEKLSACLEGRDSYPDEDGNRIQCDPTDFTREVTGKPCPDIESWELFGEKGERLL